MPYMILQKKVGTGADVPTDWSTLNNNVLFGGESTTRKGSLLAETFSLNKNTMVVFSDYDNDTIGLYVGTVNVDSNTGVVTENPQTTSLVGVRPSSFTFPVVQIGPNKLVCAFTDTNNQGTINICIVTVSGGVPTISSQVIPRLSTISSPNIDLAVLDSNTVALAIGEYGGGGWHRVVSVDVSGSAPIVNQQHTIVDSENISTVPKIVAITPTKVAIMRTRASGTLPGLWVSIADMDNNGVFTVSSSVRLSTSTTWRVDDFTISQDGTHVAYTYNDMDNDTWYVRGGIWNGSSFVFGSIRAIGNFFQNTTFGRCEFTLNDQVVVSSYLNNGTWRILMASVYQFTSVATPQTLYQVSSSYVTLSHSNNINAQNPSLHIRGDIGIKTYNRISAEGSYIGWEIIKP